MLRAFLVLLTAAFACPALADRVPSTPDDKDDVTKKELTRKKTGRPGELTPEEEERLDKIVNYFIQYDIGMHRDPRAVVEFNKLGPEAIPALIRGLNRAAQMSHSCPVAVIGKKLKQLLVATDDEEVLDFARENIGAGTPARGPYVGILNDLKWTCMQRKRQLQTLKVQSQPGPSTSPGSRPPGSRFPFDK
jgi:hypothetical protein